MEPFDIRKLREDAEMDLEQFSKLVGIQIGTLTQLETDHTIIENSHRTKVLSALNKHYSTPPNYDKTREEAIASTLKGMEPVVRKNSDLLQHDKIPQFDIYIHRLYDEAQKALLLNLHSSALFTLLVLIEYLLKDRIKDERNKRNGGMLQPSEEENIENYLLKKVIGQSHRLKIISDKEKEELSKLEKAVRNPTLHSNLMKATQGMQALNIPVITIATGTVRQEDLSAEKNRFFRKLLVTKLHEFAALPLFHWVDTFIKQQYADTIERAKCGELGSVYVGRD